jgi:hypothetical protein
MYLTFLFVLEQRTTTNSLQTASIPSSLVQAERHTSKPRTGATRRSRVRMASRHRTCTHHQVLIQQHNKTMETYRFIVTATSTIRMMCLSWIENFSLKVVCCFGGSFSVSYQAHRESRCAFLLVLSLVWLLFLYVILVVLALPKPVHAVCGRCNCLPVLIISLLYISFLNT